MWVSTLHHAFFEEDLINVLRYICHLQLLRKRITRKSSKVTKKVYNVGAECTSRTARGRYVSAINRALQSGVTHHRLVRVLLKLHKSDASDVLEIQIAVLAFKIVAAVQIRQKRRRCYSGGFLTVDLVAGNVVRLQERLKQIAKRNCKLNP